MLDLAATYRSGPVEFGVAVENLTNTRWRSSEFFYASCAPGEACGAGVDDFHFTPGNPRGVRCWVRTTF